MPKSRHGGARHAQRPSWRHRLTHAPTTLAVVGLAALFVVSGVLALRVMTVPSKLRTEAGGPDRSHPTAVRLTNRPTAGHPARSDHRADRSDARTPSPAAKVSAAQRLAAAPATTRASMKSPTPTTSPRPKPSPSPSQSSGGGPLPLPTLSP